MFGSLSINATCFPKIAALIAALVPAGPPPITTRSNDSLELSMHCYLHCSEFFEITERLKR
jgi:hypothetical protein